MRSIVCRRNTAFHIQFVNSFGYLPDAISHRICYKRLRFTSIICGMQPRKKDVFFLIFNQLQYEILDFKSNLVIMIDLFSNLYFGSPR